MDSDDDNVINYGTPLATDKDEDEVPRKRPVPIEEQTVTDARGLRRFHGAFTGGFSAGYFNTVGTKEGWTPSSFQSSRSSRAGKTGQRPEDFMDEEDLGQFGIAPRAVHVTKSFAGDSKGGSSMKRHREEAGGGRSAIPGIPPLKDLIVPSSESAGNRILRKMGWKPGQGIGPRVSSRKLTMNRSNARSSDQQSKAYGCQPPNRFSVSTSKSGADEEDNDENDDDDILSGMTFAPEDVATFHMSVAKDNCHGIGYTGLDRAPVLSTFSGRRLEAPPVRDAKKKLAIRGEAFGVGAYEDEDENIYSIDDMSQYDFELQDRSTKKANKDESRGRLLAAVGHLGAVLEGFHLATKPPPPKTVYQPPPLPRDYRPGRKTASSSAQPPSTAAHHRAPMRAADRAAIVGGSGDGDSVMDMLRREDRVRLETALARIRGGDPGAPSSAQSFRPFGQDADKQRRYELFNKLKETNNEEAFQACQPRTMTEWERQRETEEFRRAAAIYKPLSRDMASRFVTAKLLDTDSAAKTAPPLAASAATPAAAEPNAVVATAEPPPAVKPIVLVKREIFDWHPDRLLCRRFNIPNPYPDSKLVGVPKSHKEKYSVYNFLTISTNDDPVDSSNIVDTTRTTDEVADSATKGTIASSPKPLGLFSCLDQMPPTTLEKTSTDTTPQSLTSSSAVKGEATEDQRPSMDLFKAIFKDTDSESSDSEDDSAGPPASVGVGTSAVRPSTSSIFSSATPSDDSGLARARPAAFGVFANLDLDSIDAATSSTAPVSRTEPTEPGRRLSSVARMVMPDVSAHSVALPPTSLVPPRTNSADLAYGPRLPESFVADRDSHGSRSVSSKTTRTPGSDSKNWIERKSHHKDGHKKHKKEKKKKKHKHKSKSNRSFDSEDSSSDSVKEVPIDKKIIERLKALQQHHR